MTKSITPEYWFVTGSQHLYGPDALTAVAEHAQVVAHGLDDSAAIPYPVVFQPIVTTPEEIRALCLRANSDDNCAGLITWMHTFSPAKMWIAGLQALQKPLLHLHTQFHRDIPWTGIDMDFMNLHQSAHGDREYGHITARLGTRRKVVVGHWQDGQVQERIGRWTRTAAGVLEGKSLKVARFGDNMREVAVTDGDKVSAQMQFGWSVNGYGVGDLVERVSAVTAAELDALLSEYAAVYDIAPATRDAQAKWASVREQARIEIGLRSFLAEGGFGAFTTTFEDLHGLAQLPGLAVQRLMAEGYGFGGEGDWKTAALVRVMKVMAGMRNTSFMEDYTYHLDPADPLILGAHMLEVCPTIAATRPRVEVHPLSIGGKADPARLVFDGKGGSAIVASVVDIGPRFRLIVNEIEAVQPTEAMPNLPVARVLWKPEPSLAESAESWIYAGGAHHTVLSYEITAEQMVDFAEMVGIECVVIRNGKSVQDVCNELRWNDLAWRL